MDLQIRRYYEIRQAAKGKSGRATRDTHSTVNFISDSRCTLSSDALEAFFIILSDTCYSEIHTRESVTIQFLVGSFHLPPKANQTYPLIRKMKVLIWAILMKKEADGSGDEQEDYIIEQEAVQSARVKLGKRFCK